MKIKYKLTATIFILILIISVINYKLLAVTVETLLVKRLESAEALLGKGLAEELYRLVIEGKHDAVTAVLFKEKNIREQKLSYIVVKDRDGQIFAHTYLTDIPDSINHFDDVFAVDESYRIDHLLNDEIAAYDIAVPIREGIIQVGTLHVGIDKKFILASASPLKEASTKILYLGFVIVTVGAALAYALSFAITQSLTKLNELARKISLGDYDAQIDISSKDEVGDLAVSLAKMRDSIQTAQDKLEAQNLNLEGLVQERTQKLEESNKELMLSYDDLEIASKDLAQERKNLKIVFSAMDYPLYVVNRDYTITMMNDRAKKLVQPDMAIPLTCHNLLHHSMHSCSEDDHPCPLNDVFMSKEPVTVEHAYLNEVGKQVVIEVRAYPIFDENNNVVQMVESCIDITDKKKSAEDNIRLERELNRAHKLESIGTLAAGVAHEINTPIQFIGDNTRFASDSAGDVFALVAKYQELFKRVQKDSSVGLAEELAEIEEEADLDYLRDELPKSLQQTLEGIEHVSAIVKAMKDFSHVGSNEKMQTENINQTIETTLIISKNEWKYVAEIEKELGTSLPEVSCHIGEIKQVFLNLIVNAAHAIADKIKQSKKAGEKGRITVNTTCDKGAVIIAISDNGMGIAAEHKTRIFDPFYTTKEVSKGTGQGLSVAYQIIVEKHGGDIWFESEVGIGTTFFVKLNVEG